MTKTAKVSGKQQATAATIESLQNELVEARKRVEKLGDQLFAKVKATDKEIEQAAWLLIEPPSPYLLEHDDSGNIDDQFWNGNLAVQVLALRE